MKHTTRRWLDALLVVNSGAALTFGFIEAAKECINARSNIAFDLIYLVAPMGLLTFALFTTLAIRILFRKEE